MTRLRRNPLEDILDPPHTSKRCGAHARSTGAPCRRWASIGHARCRLHGGAKRSGRPPTHGKRSLKAQRERRLARVVEYLLRMNYEMPVAIERDDAEQDSIQ